MLTDVWSDQVMDPMSERVIHCSSHLSAKKVYSGVGVVGNREEGEVFLHCVVTSQHIVKVAGSEKVLHG